MPLTLPPDLMRVLRDRFAVTRLRPGQVEVIDSVLAGNDTLALMPTGSGKSLCFQLPALLREGLTVVVSPLISLMQDQAAKLADIGLPAAVVNSVEGYAALEPLAQGSKRIVLTTPEQLQNEPVVEALQQNQIVLMVVDEAHCISQWGHDFRPAYLALRGAIAALGGPPVLALTATATDKVLDDIESQLGLRQPRLVRAPLFRPNLVFAVEPATGDAHRFDVVRRLALETRGSGIIYTASIQAAKRLHDMLLKAGAAVVLYHGRRSAAQRREAQEAFMAGDARVMVATNAFGMGIDKPDVRFIVHAQLPGSLDAYYQECGRAGRDGDTAYCTLVFDEKDKRIHLFFLANRYPSATDLRQMARALSHEAPLTISGLREILPEMGLRRLQVGMQMLADFDIVRRDRRGRFSLLDARPNGIDAIAARYEARVSEDRDRLQAMLDYARSGRCRWATLLAYYGEADMPDGCGTCDSCRRMAEVATPAGDTAPVPAGPSVAAPVQAFAEGDTVRARRFGEGTVVSVTDAMVEVLFSDESVRRFLPQYLRRVHQAPTSAAGT